jgi:hypothetical protein
MTTAGAREIAEFTMLATEAGSGVRAFEAAHTSDRTFETVMILFKTVLEVDAGPVRTVLPARRGSPSGRSHGHPSLRSFNCRPQSRQRNRR